MLTNVKVIVKTAACLAVLAASVSACSTTVAPEDNGTTEYVFKQTKSDQVLSKDDSITSSKVEGD